jgi:hypothetical protein
MGCHRPIIGQEHAGLSASIDMIRQFSRTTSSRDELLARFSPVGLHVDAVAEQINHGARRYQCGSASDQPTWSR